MAPWAQFILSMHFVHLAFLFPAPIAKLPCPATFSKNCEADDAEETIKLLAALDETEKIHFQPLIKEASDKLRTQDQMRTFRKRKQIEHEVLEGLEKKRKQDVPVQEDEKPAASSSNSGLVKGPQVHTKKTPKEFKSLLPNGGNVTGMSGKHDPVKRFFSVVYPCV